MKGLFFGLLLALTCSVANANTVTLNSQNKDYELAKVPQNLMAAFVDQGFIQEESSTNVWDLTITGLRCDTQSRDALYPDYSNAGLPSVKCYVNAAPERLGAGSPIQESRYINSLINVIEAKANGEYSDCSMGGKCSSYIALIKCRIDLNQEEMHNAYSCKLE
ncbi:MAG: hypothetical protein H7336_08760 [Bacteriovorax sp.]|nr:hypothetical protein [Bacteriovorax sp.]